MVLFSSCPRLIVSVCIVLGDWLATVIVLLH